jgi:hypothetical protein
MVTESRACPSCGDSVPPGRLSCPHCGAVLAAVAHRVESGVTMEWRAPEVPPAPQDRPASAEAPAAAVADDGWDADAGEAGQPDPVEPAWDEPATDVAPVAQVASPWSAAAAAAGAESPRPPSAGGYVPPAVEPELPPAPQAAEPPPPPAVPELTEPPPVPIRPRAWDPVAAAAGDGAAPAVPATPGRVGGIAMPRIDRERVEETADVLMLVGSFGLVLSFLAPWAAVVIGSRGSAYMDTWGLAGPGHIALFLLALGVLALAALQNPIGRWLRTGVAGVALGAFVLGLAWPYVVGPLGAGPGALLAWVSGLVLFVAGIVSLLVLRHAALAPDV